MTVRPRLLLAVVLAAAAVGAALLLLLRARYPAGAPYVASPPTEQPQPFAGRRGWTWPHGVPGFRFGVDESRWNGGALRPSEVGGEDVRVLVSQRFAGGLGAVVARPGADGRTCLGFVLGAPPARFVCDLDRQKAFLIVATERGMTSVVGVARGDVQEARLAGSPGGTGYLYARWGMTAGWGAFGSGWSSRAGATAVFRDAHGARLATLRLARDGAPLRLVVVR